ncbi:hypothetical protein NLG42_03040 [Flavobacterium plurextorum]|uniref:hypothetical protein n=1 Tax=Flavobacterium TaxID=237 RepID=UPI00214D8220|nr:MULTISPECIES: hypothetical protein [Flavobacterium]UUW09781.1 hypothetical protein NLG42_03040 [Flavobacterium plurextorum]
MKLINIKLKELPKDTKFATFDSNNEDIILGEYLIAKLLYNGFTLNQILEQANEIEDMREREDVKSIITHISLNFISLNPEYSYLINENYGKREFWNSLGINV